MLERRILVSSLGRFDCDDLYNFRYLVAGDEDLSSQFDIAIRLAMTANVEVDQKKKNILDIEVASNLRQGTLYCSKQIQ